MISEQQFQRFIKSMKKHNGHHCSFDSRRHRPEWGNQFANHTDDNNCLWGYIWDGGELHGVKAVEQKTTYAWEPFRPEAVETILIGSNGRSYRIKGRQIATTQTQCWPNQTGAFALMEWDCGEKGTAYGDVQMCTWSDAYKLMESFKSCK